MTPSVREIARNIGVLQAAVLGVAIEKRIIRMPGAEFAGAVHSLREMGLLIDMGAGGAPCYEATLMGHKVHKELMQ